MSGKQPARRGVSEKTVRNHASDVYMKIHTFGCTHAVIYADREGR